ncbi:MAG: DUF1844 domain-containing protein [Sedimentisphaerales bacterium]|nr:DUF1844 domain-containing protein [Sedimentisphaerales bacterium]
MSNQDQERKIVSDDDWKAQAKADKEKLIEKEKQEKAAQQTTEAKSTAAPGAKKNQPSPMPPASFLTLVNSLAVQALFCLGKLGPAEGDKKPKVNLDLAKHHIDMLGVLEEKTKGNLTEDENQLLSRTLHELRMQYVSTAQF